MEDTELIWRKSSRSTTNGGACVEVAATGAAVFVRDSTDPGGPVLGRETSIAPAEWRSFLASLR